MNCTVLYNGLEQKKAELLAPAGMQTLAVQEQRSRQLAELNERRSRLRAGEGDEAGAAAMQILDESADQEEECAARRRINNSLLID